MMILNTRYSIILVSLLISIWGCSIGETTASGNATEAGNPALATVTGVLVDSNGIPMPLIPVSLSLVDTGVVVLLKTADVSSVVYFDTTDEQGVYAIEEIPEGSYTLSATPPGEEPRVIVALNATNDSVITLEPIDIFAEVVVSSSSELLESSSVLVSSDITESSTQLSSSSMIVSSSSMSSSEIVLEDGELELQFRSDIYELADIAIELSGLDTVYNFQYTNDTKIFLIDLPPGQYDLTITIPDVRIIERTIQIDPSLELEFEVRLEEYTGDLPGLFRVECISYHKDERDVTIAIEGITPAFIHHYTIDERVFEESIPAGTYTVTITPEGGIATTRTLYMVGDLEVDWEILID